MCGIVGYLDKTANQPAPIGEVLFGMLRTLSDRGPDSAGVAIFGASQEEKLILRIKLGDREHFQKQAERLVNRLERLVRVYEKEVLSEYLRLVVASSGDIQELISHVEGTGEGVGLVSAGKRLEIVKQVGSPANLDRSYHIRSLVGTHGIGHTRLSTESRVDLSHSQPFWAHGVPDLATVHNGHIANYHKLRRQYEQRGFRFYTENDSEIIGTYLRDQMAQGHSLEQALEASLDDFDGSFSYLAANEHCMALVKDRFAFKPLMLTESDQFVAIATEEIALRKGLQGPFQVHEPSARQVQMWSVSACADETVA